MAESEKTTEYKELKKKSEKIISKLKEFMEEIKILEKASFLNLKELIKKI